MTKPILTQEFLKEVLHYDPDTGFFTWRTSNSNRVRVGDVAGSLKDGYMQIGINGWRYKSHRLAFLYMTGGMPQADIDHINHIRDDNRWINIRSATRQENRRNCSISPKNTSGFNGVSWYKAQRLWSAQITLDREKIHLGYFENIKDAIRIRKEANVKYNFHQNHGI